MFLLLSALPLCAQTATNDPFALAPAYGEIPATFWERHGTGICIGVPLFLALGAWVCWALFRPRSQPVPPPADRARAALAKIQGQTEDAAIVGAISRIVREYVCAACQLPPGEWTTADLSAAIGHNEQLGAELAKAIADFLRECDEQKFSTGTAAFPLGGAHRAWRLIEMAEQRRAAGQPQPSAAQ